MKLSDRLFYITCGFIIGCVCGVTIFAATAREKNQIVEHETGGELVWTADSSIAVPNPRMTALTCSLTFYDEASDKETGRIEWCEIDVDGKAHRIPIRFTGDIDRSARLFFQHLIGTIYPEECQARCGC
jgi:hypothetical protein